MKKISLFLIVAFGLGILSTFVFAKEPEEIVVEVPKIAPVLQRIAGCESQNDSTKPGTHYRNGQVILNGNKNGSVDIGKYMINNATWSATATAKGLNLMLEKDNEEFAKFLYAEHGTEPWSATKNCWK